MSKLVFPGVGAPYRGFISELRTWLQRTASWVEKSPGALADLQSTVNVLNADIGITAQNPASAYAEVEGGSINVTNATSGDAHVALISSAPVNGQITDLRLGASVAMVDTNDTVAVRNSAGADSHNGTAVVNAAGTFTGVNLAATTAMVDQGDTSTVGDSAGTQAALSISVAAGAIAGITVPATTKLINSTIKYTGPAITGTYVDGYTFTIAAGQITAIAAS